MRYSEFIVRIGPPQQGTHRVSARFRGGEENGDFAIPFTPQEMTAAAWFVDSSQARWLGLHPREVGDRLFHALFSGPVGDFFKRSSETVSGSADLGLRLRIEIDTGGLASPALPWELLRWTDLGEFLALSRWSPIVRSLAVPRPIPRRLRQPIEPPLRILAAMASPPGSGPLDLDEEWNTLEKTCGAIPGVDLKLVQDVSAPGIHRALRASPPVHVLHFMGHGTFDPVTGDGSLLLTDDRVPMKGRALAQILHDFPSLRLAVLNACHTARSATGGGRDVFAGVATALLQNGLNAVVGMQAPISDDAAILFSGAFYASLADGEPIDTAMSEARKAVYQADLEGSEWATPVLFLRGPNGRLFDDRRGRGSLTQDLLKIYLRGLIERLNELAPAGMDAVVHSLRCRRFDPFAIREDRQAPPPSALAIEESPFRCERRIVLLGDPGSGKTTLLRRTALEHARASLAGESRLARVPVLVPLADYATARHLSPGLTLKAFLGYHLAPGLPEAQWSQGEALPLKPLHDHFIRLWERGGILVLLDGLDEITDVGERYEVAREIDQFLSTWTPEPDRGEGAQVAVTSRLAGYRATPLGVRASHWLLEALGPGAVRHPSATRRMRGEESAAMADPRPPQDRDPADANPRPVTLLSPLDSLGWRESLRLALGRMSANLEGPNRTAVVLDLLASIDTLGVLLPRAAELISQAVPDLAAVAAPALEAAAANLIAAWAEHRRGGGPSALVRSIERAFARLAGAAPISPVDRALLQALLGDSDEICLAAAHLVRIAGRVTAELTETLAVALPRDTEEHGWPIDAALREIAARRSDLLPSLPGTFRHGLRRNASWLQTFQGDPCWRRIGLALYGDWRGPDGMFRESPLTPRLRTSLEAGRTDRALICDLRKALSEPAEQVRADALLALAACGEPMTAELSANDPSAWKARAQLSRLAAGLNAAIPPAAGPTLRTLATAASHLPANRWQELMAATLEVTRAFGDPPVPILALAEAAPPEVRPHVLAEVWRSVLASTHGDPVYNLAVMLDTAGETLASPPLLLARTLTAGGWSRGRLAPRPRSEIKLLAAALDSLDGLASAFDFARGWALAILAPSLRETGLALEAVALALGSLSDRFDARTDALHALAGPGFPAAETLLPEALNLDDSFLRFRALLRLAHTWPRLWDALLATPSVAGWRQWLWPGGSHPTLAREALRLPDPVDRAWALEALAAIDADRHTRWAALALRAARRVADPDDRARALARLAPHFPPRQRDRLLAQALEAACRIAGEEGRAETLSALRAGTAVSPRLQRRFQGIVAGLGDPLCQARTRGLAAPVLLTAGETLGGQADPLVLGAIVHDLRSELALLPHREAPEPAVDQVERQGLSAQTLPGLLDLLESSDDRLRHRAALALHGDLSPGVPPLSAARLGPGPLEELAQRWLALKDRAPGAAKVIGWTFERVEHDDGDALTAWVQKLAGSGPEARVAEVILSSIERLHPFAEPAFRRLLKEGSPPVQRALLHSLCRLLARDRIRDELWNEISPSLSDLGPEAGRDLFLADPPAALVDALLDAWDTAGGVAESVPSIADRFLLGSSMSLVEALQGPGMRERLKSAGLASRPSFPQLRAAADRLAARPELLPALLAWLCVRLGRDVQDGEPFCPINSDLLALSAALAERLPADYQKAAQELPELSLRLRDAARQHDSFPGRRAALRLLAASGRLTCHAWDALQSGLGDVPPVQAVALDSLGLYQEADDEVLQHLIQGLDTVAPLAAVAAGRLLALFARRGILTTKQRGEALRALPKNASNGSQIDVCILSPQPPLRLESLGSLDALLYDSLADVAGLADLLEPVASAPQEGP